MFQHPFRGHRWFHQDEFQQNCQSVGGTTQRPLRKIRLPLQAVRMRENINPGRLLLCCVRWSVLVLWPYNSSMLNSSQWYESRKWQYLFLGCPEPVPNHAKNCVEMGLAMIHAIREFDEDRHESVNMRVSATAFMISNESEVQRSEIKKCWNVLFYIW